MRKIFKRVTGYTLAGAIAAGSFGAYSQVDAKEADTSEKQIVAFKENREKTYIVKYNNKMVIETRLI